MGDPAAPNLLGDVIKVMLPVSLLLVAGIYYVVYRVVCWMDRNDYLPGQAEEKRQAERRARAARERTGGEDPKA
ncbi:MAG TPA: hypothetical protein VFE30_12015 [Anaeromyxobacteraceae bacterium]|jgi:hypothetical protein|nr:hypothetical protein [Anaeromyxobacteraceae bacterium]